MQSDFDKTPVNKAPAVPPRPSINAKSAAVKKVTTTHICTLFNDFNRE